MVNDAGQLYTMEGVAAGLIMLLTAYIVVSTTSIYTTGDTHIPDMQLEQLGSDVLAMMDTPNGIGGERQLTGFVKNNQRDALRDEFLFLANRTTGARDPGDPDDNLQAQVFLSYRRTDSSVNTTQISSPSDPGFTGRENAVRVTRWVQLPQGSYSHMPNIDTSRPNAVLVEVLLWRA